MSNCKPKTDSVSKEAIETKEQNDDHALGLKLYNLYWLLVEANADIKKNKWKRKIRDSI
jgi:hypothetical protein